MVKTNQPHEGANISGEVPPAGRGAQILLRIEPVRVDHEAAVRQVAAAREGETIHRNLLKKNNQPKII